MSIALASSFRTPNADQIERCFNAISQSKVIGFDVESSGLSWQQNFVCGYVLTVGPRPDETWYLPVRHGGGGNIPGCSIPKAADGWVGDIHWIERRLAEEVASRQDIHIFGHNVKYDLHMAANHGVWFQGTVEDTRTNAALIDELQGGFDLDFCAKLAGVVAKQTSVYAYIKQQRQSRGLPCPADYKAMEFFWETPAEGEAGDYAAGDGVTTWALRDYQLEQIRIQELDRVYGVEKRVTKTLFRMERRGVPVDEEKLNLVEKKIAVLLNAASLKLPKGLNSRSPIQMRAYMESLGKEGWPMTAPSLKFPNGQPSFAEGWLKGFPEGKDILAVRKLSNLINTFIKGSIRENLWRGRVHCNFNQCAMDEYGTVSGRLSCNSPNMLQIPKRDPVIAPLLRQIYRPRSPFRWWSADYSQQEYRVFAEYAQAKMVLEAYARDPRTDYHQLVADLLNVERDPAAKRINLGTIYNMGTKKLASQLECSFEIADGYRRKMLEVMPEAPQFNRDAQTTAERRGFVKTKLGRRRRFPGGEYAHKAGNAVIQGSSADITKSKMVQIDEFLVDEGAESGLMLQTYDSMDFEYLEDERRLMERSVEMMEDFGINNMIQLSVPMIVDFSDGDSWGHATFGKKYKEWL